MRLLDWLFGKKETTGAATLCDKQAAGAVAVTCQEKNGLAAPIEAKRTTTEHQESQRLPAVEVDNLKRWRESGKARAWVEKRQGCWNHDDWLGLLEELRRSAFWPMQADAVGLVLEDEKRQWLERN
jgi:hypothetical protein